MVQIVHQDPAQSEEKEEQTKEALGKMRAESIEKEAAALANSVGLPYIDFHVFPVDAETLFLITEKEARALIAAFLIWDCRCLAFAMANR